MCLYRCYEEELSQLSDQELGQLLRAMLHYLNTGENISLRGVVRKIWPRYRIQHDRDAAHYHEISEKRRDVAAKRWSKQSRSEEETEDMQLDAIACNCIDKEKEEEKEKEKEKLSLSTESGERELGGIPSVSDVNAYCLEQGFSHMDAARFVDYYNAIGWTVGDKPLRDWKAMVRLWEHRARKEHGNTAAVGEVNYGETF